MFAIQPLTLPPAAQQLLGLDPAADTQADPGFAAQFSALLAQVGPAQTASVASPAPLRPALPGSRGGKDAAENGKLPGNQGGNILPESIADIEEPQAPEDTASQSAGALPTEVVLPSTAPALQFVLAPIEAPTPPSGPAQDEAVQARAYSAPVANAAAATLAAEAQPSRWLAQASTAPATSSTQLPQGPGGAAALPPVSAERSGDPAIAAATLPAIRIPRAAALTGAPFVRLANIETTLSAAADEPIPGRVKFTPVSQPATLAVQASGEAQAASTALAQQVRKPADPAALAAPLGVPEAQPAAGLEVIAASAQQPAANMGGLGIVVPQAGTPQSHDFAALIDRLVEARQAVQATAANQTVLASVQHAEFGHVSLAFQQDAGGLTVSFANPDPDLARAVQSLAPVAASANSGETGAGAQRQDWQGSGSAGSGHAQGHAPAQQQRNQSPQREPGLGSAAPERNPDNDPASPSASRGGIFA